MKKFLDRMFGAAEEIDGAGRCPVYLYRWTLLRRRGVFGLYLHHFVGDDWSRDLHDHPKRFISLGLWGWYIEETPTGYHGVVKTKRYDAPWLRTFPATHIHRLSVPSKNCWTLVLVLKPVREWGFWHDGSFIQWQRYVDGEGGVADEMKVCD
jgi:hypothetical protein